MSRQMMISSLLLTIALALARATQPNEQPALKDAEKRLSSKEMSIAGNIEADETKLARITARLKGRIDKLHIKVAGGKVKKGEPLAELYSPDLMVATQNLLDAQRSENRELERNAMERLRLWGLDEQQIKTIVKAGKPAGQMTLRSPISGHLLRKYRLEGEYVDEGAQLFDLVDLSTVWVEAAFAEDAFAVLKEGWHARVTAKALPNREFRGEVLGGLNFDRATRTIKVRFAVENPREELLPGMFAMVRLEAPEERRDTKDAKVKELVNERLATLKTLVKAATVDYHAGRASFERVQQATRALLDAELEQCSSDRERVAILEKIVALAKDSEKSALARYKTGATPQSDALMATAARLETEIALERAKLRAAPPK